MELRKSVFMTEPEIKNCLFGYKPDTGSVDGLGEKNELLREDPIGGVMDHQINCAARTAAGLGNAVQLDREWVIGKSIKGSSMGGLYDITS